MERMRRKVKLKEPVRTPDAPMSALEPLPSPLPRLPPLRGLTSGSGSVFGPSPALPGLPSIPRGLEPLNTAEPDRSESTTEEASSTEEEEEKVRRSLLREKEERMRHFQEELRKKEEEEKRKLKEESEAKLKELQNAVERETSAERERLSVQKKTDMERLEEEEVVEETKSLKEKTDLQHRVDELELKNEDEQLKEKDEELIRRRRKLKEGEDEMDRRMETLAQLSQERNLLKEELERMREEKLEAREVIQRLREEKMEAREEEEERWREEQERIKEERHEAQELLRTMKEERDRALDQCQKAKEENEKLGGRVMLLQERCENLVLRVRELEKGEKCLVSGSQHRQGKDFKEKIAALAPSSGKSDASHDVEFLGALSLTESQDHAVKIEEMVKNLLQEARTLSKLELSSRREKELLQPSSVKSPEFLCKDLSALPGEVRMTESDLSCTVDHVETGRSTPHPAKVQECLQQISGQLNTVLTALATTSHTEFPLPQSVVCDPPRPWDPSSLALPHRTGFHRPLGGSVPKYDSAAQILLTSPKLQRQIDRMKVWLKMRKKDVNMYPSGSHCNLNKESSRAEF
ncbi:trichohyalin-like isoform X2 [Cynoglossus semilaevis]|uniref:trichohyalin-like isoform X2 n=1 Tax=Cynoglossus semilaevis TaxID=244447 RepID=UPI00049523BE|nr:trichohyalin-like isoform X2 [Cynoglossus semilaevis]